MMEGLDRMAGEALQGLAVVVVCWLVVALIFGLGPLIALAARAGERLIERRRRRREQVPRYVISEVGMTPEEKRARRQRWIQPPERSMKLGGIEPGE